MIDLDIHRSGLSEFPQHVRMLLVGQPGVGKTTLARSFPHPLWVNAGCGLTTLAQFSDTPFINYNVESDLFALKQALELEVLDFPVDTLVVDSVDELQRLLLVERLKKENRSETKLDDWGWLNSRMHAIFAGLSQLPINIIYIAHTKEVNVGDEVIIKPALGGQFCEHIHEYVDMSLLMRASTLLEDQIETVQVLDSPEDSFQISLAKDSVPVVNRWILSSSQPEAEWVHDKTNALPSALFPASRLFDVISERFASITLPESSSKTYNIDPDTQASESAEEIDVVDELSVDVSQDTSGAICSECSKEIDAKTWIDLSNMRFGVTLCGDCFKKKG